MANAGRMRLAAESTKTSATSNVPVKPSRPLKSATRAKGRDNPAFVAGIGTVADTDRGLPCSAKAYTATASEKGEPSFRACADLAKMKYSQPKRICKPGNKCSSNGANGQFTAIEGEKRTGVATEKPCNATFARILEEPYSSGPLIDSGRKQMLDAEMPFLKYDSSTAIETLVIGRSESPVYEELDFKSASFRDLNSEPQRLNSANISISSAELSIPRRRLPPGAPQVVHRGQYSSPSCGIRIAEMRASRKFEGLQTSPSSTSSSSASTTPSRARTSPCDRVLLRSKPLPNQASDSPSQSSECENHRSSLDLNVTYVEHFDATIPKPCCNSQTALLLCVPVTHSSLSSTSLSHPSTSSQFGEHRASTSSSSTQTNFIKSHRRSATSSSIGKERDFAAANNQRSPKFTTRNLSCTAAQREEKICAARSAINIMSVYTECQYKKSPVHEIQPDSNKKTVQESETKNISEKVTEPEFPVPPLVDWESSLTEHSSISEPDNSSDCSASLASISNSTETLIASVASSKSLTEGTTNNEFLLSETVGDSNHSNVSDQLSSVDGRQADQMKPQPCIPTQSSVQTHRSRGLRQVGKSDKFKANLEGETTASSALSCLVQKQECLNTPSPTRLSSIVPLKTSIQRHENPSSRVKLRIKAATTHSVKLSKSCSSTDLPRNNSHSQVPAHETSKSATNSSILSGKAASPKSLSVKEKILAAPLKAAILGVQSSASNAVQVHNHSSDVGVSSSKADVKFSGKPDSAARSDKLDRFIAREDEFKVSSTASVGIPDGATPRLRRSVRSPICSNVPGRQPTIQIKEGSQKSQTAYLSSASTSESSVKSFPLQQELSSIAERDPEENTSSIALGEATSGITCSRAKTSKGQISPPLLTFMGLNTTITAPLWRNLSISQRATSMSKISSRKHNSITSSFVSKKNEIHNLYQDEQAIFSADVSRMSEISKSQTNIYDRVAKEPPVQRAVGGQRFNANSCLALNTCTKFQKSDCSRREEDKVCRLSGTCSSSIIKTNARDRVVGLNGNSSRSPSSLVSRPDNEQQNSPSANETINFNIKEHIPAESSRNMFSSKLRTPTNFSSNKRQEKLDDRNRNHSVSVKGSSRVLSSNSVSEEMPTKEQNQPIATSLFKHLKLQHVKPYASTGSKGTSFAEKFVKSRINTEVRNCKVAAGTERNREGVNQGAKQEVELNIINSTMTTGIQLASSISFGCSEKLEDMQTVSESDRPSSSEVEAKYQTASDIMDKSVCELSAPVCTPNNLYVNDIESLSMNSGNFKRILSPVPQEVVNATAFPSSVDDIANVNCASFGHLDNAFANTSQNEFVQTRKSLLLSDTSNWQEGLSDSELNPVQVIKYASSSDSLKTGTRDILSTDIPCLYKEVIAQSIEGISSDTDYDSVPVSGDEILSEAEGLVLDPRAYANDSKRNSPRSSRISDSEESATSNSTHVDDGSEPGVGSPSLFEAKGVQVLSHQPVPQKTAKMHVEDGSQTLLDNGHPIEGILFKPANRNSLVLVDQEKTLRDIDKFVVTYESENIIVLERADSILCSKPSSLELEDGVSVSSTAVSDSPVSLKSSDIARKLVKHCLSSSRPTDLKLVTSPKSEPGNLPLSESGYDSWKSQSSKSSARLLRLAESEIYTIPDISLQRCKSSEERDLENIYTGCKETDKLFKAYRNNDDSLSMILTSSFEKNTQPSSNTDNSTTAILGRDDKENASVQRLDHGHFYQSSMNTWQKTETNLECNNMQDKVISVRQPFVGEEISLEGCYSSFSSFPSSNSSLMEALEHIRLTSVDGTEQLTDLKKSIEMISPLSLRWSEENPDSSFFPEQHDLPELINFGFESRHKLNSNPAPYHSRDYHNRIYKLDFGAGDSDELTIDHDDLDNCSGRSKEKMWAKNIFYSGYSKSDYAGISIFKDNFSHPFKCSRRSKSVPLQQTSTLSDEIITKARKRIIDTGSYTFPLVIKKTRTLADQHQERKARTVGTECQIYSRTNKTSERNAERETFYESLCDAMLESLEADVSDSDNTSPTTPDIDKSVKCEYLSEERTNVGALSILSMNKVANSKVNVGKLCLPENSGFRDHSYKTKVTYCEDFSNPASSGPDLLYAHEIDAPSHCEHLFQKYCPTQAKCCQDKFDFGTQSNISATKGFTNDSFRFSAQVGPQEESTCVKNCDSSLITRQTGLETDFPLNTCKELLWVSRYCIHEQKPKTGPNNQPIDISEDISSDAGSNLSADVINIGVNKSKHESDRIKHECNFVLASAEQKMIRSASSSSDAAVLAPCKEEMKNSSGILTRYLPALLRKPAKYRHSTQGIVLRCEQNFTSGSFNVSRNSVPLSCNINCKNSVERSQEPRPVREAIKEFEDKTTAHVRNSEDISKSQEKSLFAPEPRGKRFKFIKNRKS